MPFCKHMRLILHIQSNGVREQLLTLNSKHCIQIILDVTTGKLSTNVVNARMFNHSDFGRVAPTF